jgi:SnoaL-like protein
MTKTLDIKWEGGSAKDRELVAAQHYNYLEANAEFDWQRLPDIFSGADYATYFNLNGHTYDGRAHWTELWKYYKSRITTGFWTPYDLKGVISGDLATVWCHRTTKSEWIGPEPDPDSHRTHGDFISRSTMVFAREGETWRAIHVHFSQSKIGEPRPGGV